MLKRSLTIAGHRTSLALEPEFWSGLEAIAAERNISMVQLIQEIDEARSAPNLSSAVRLAVLRWYQDRADQSFAQNAGGPTGKPRSSG